MGIDYYGLWVGVADDPYALVADKFVEVVFKLRSEVVALKAVDGAVETHQRVEGDHTRTLCAQVRVVVSAIEQVVDTWFVRDCSEESSHICE
jgi:hypothetical protein